VSNITAVMVDGDRDDPTVAYSRRSDAAVQRAATAFAAELGADVVVGDSITAPADAKELGSVRSAPVRDLVRHLLTYSDNTLAEALARLVAVERGAGNDFSSIQAGTTEALAELGLDVEGVRLADGSGLSRDDAVPAAVVTRLLVEVARHTDDLEAVDDGLAVAGRSGTLAEDGRFSGENADAAGRIRAKSGTLSDMSGLAGVANAADGTTVAFTIWAEDTPPGSATTDARAAVDALAAEVFRCGAAL
jgi:D-alanyl-D-alanine carboxypeptidase/D-alanyl-D-alanine-endopeptidase (penicillin-binding protein 4)